MPAAHPPGISLPLELRLSGHSPLRLDAALALALPCLSLRSRRRLWQWCRVTVNGRARKPGFQVFPGDVLRLEAMPENAPGTDERRNGPLRNHPPQSFLPQNHLEDAPRLLCRQGAYLALYKPAGLHSAAIAASPAPSLESMLERLCARPESEEGSANEARPILLTRLDRQTSGIVLAARHREALEYFRETERAGLADKTYLAIVRGELSRALVLTRALDTAGRSVTRVLAGEDPDPARHTRVRPLRVLATEETAALFPFPEHNLVCTLVRAHIRRGARHQIRAHLAEAGFALLGETLYAPPLGPDPPLFLHHARVRFPLPEGGSFAASCPPILFSGLTDPAVAPVAKVETDREPGATSWT